MSNAKEIAQYITSVMAVDPLKLQKLLYYCQAVYLVLNEGEPLFEDEIEAWAYGPVIPSVYHEYKQFGFGAIEPKEQDTFLQLTPNVLEAIDLVLGYYGAKTGIELVNKTHTELPWQEAYQNGVNTVISVQSMYDFYKEILTINEEA